MSTESVRTVWVTGATSGIGQACVEMLAQQGNRVVALGRRADRLHQLQADLCDHAVHTIACDVQDHEAVAQAFASLPESFAQVDALVNNAGLMLGVGTFETLTPSQMHTMVMTNCMGVLHNTSVLLPSLRTSANGHIVNVTSVAAFYPYVTGHVYAATKAFVEQFSLNLRCDLHGKNVRVTNIEPGLVETEFSLVRFGGDQARYDATYAGAEPIQPQDIADTIFWVMNTPAHVNINRLELMPVSQTWAGFAIERGAKG